MQKMPNLPGVLDLRAVTGPGRANASEHPRQVGHIPCVHKAPQTIFLTLTASQRAGVSTEVHLAFSPSDAAEAASFLFI